MLVWSAEKVGLEEGLKSMQQISDLMQAFPKIMLISIMFSLHNISFYHSIHQLLYFEEYENCRLGFVPILPLLQPFSTLHLPAQKVWDGSNMVLKHKTNC